MVILHVAEYASGGVATYLKHLIEAQIKDQRVDHIYLMLSEYNSDQELLKLKRDKLTVVAYKYRRSIFGVLKILSLFKTVVKINPTVVHLHSSFAGLLRLRFLFSSLKKRTVYCAHGWSFNRDISTSKKVMYKCLEKFLSHGCQKIINISYSEEASAKFLAKNKSTMIYNSIPSVPLEKEFNEQRKSKKINLLFVGRLDKQKGIDLLLKSLSDDRLKHKFMLTVIGDAVLDKRYSNMDYENVEFLGWRDQNVVTQELLNSDALVIPSRWEGFGLVSLEAMRAKTMVVASNAGALPEIVVDGVTGLIFESNSVEALSEVLLKLSNFPRKSIKNMGIEGKRRFDEDFNYSEMVRKIMLVYTSM